MNVLQMMRDAKAHRDATGVVIPALDEQLARAEQGDFGTILGPEDTRTLSAGAVITGVKRSGTGAVATEYTHERPGPGGNGMIGYGTPNLMTDNQRAYIVRLLTQLKDRRWADFDRAKEWYDRTENTMTKALASETIDRLKRHLSNNALALPVGPRSGWAEFRELARPLVGHRYAVTGNEGHTVFWYITEYEWDGRKMIGLRQVIGGRGPVRVKLSADASISVIRRILADGPQAAMERYGRELGKCGACGLSLTDEESRRLGIGPVCRSKSYAW